MARWKATWLGRSPLSAFKAYSFSLGRVTHHQYNAHCTARRSSVPGTGNGKHNWVTACGARTNPLLYLSSSSTTWIKWLHRWLSWIVSVFSPFLGVYIVINKLKYGYSVRSLQSWRCNYIYFLTENVLFLWYILLS